MATLLEQLEAMRNATRGILHSSCGQKILIFDHHIFHLASITRPEKRVLSMPEERAEMENTLEGFGPYRLDHGASRAKNLPSAFACMRDPDEVWTDNPRVNTAKWVYLKQFASLPYPYTVSFIGERPNEGGIIVPFSSFPCMRKDLKRWRAGRVLYRKQLGPPEGGPG
jgi:hypothetical protein